MNRGESFFVQQGGKSECGEPYRTGISHRDIAQGQTLCGEFAGKSIPTGIGVEIEGDFGTNGGIFRSSTCRRGGQKPTSRSKPRSRHAICLGAECAGAELVKKPPQMSRQSLARRWFAGRSWPPWSSLGGSFFARQVAPLGYSLRREDPPAVRSSPSVYCIGTVPQ